ncbi:MAG: TonB-dependent receptor [Calditrichaeota bacterium]|nr:TonB-dependent receptor [Calditrichota bacterium]MBT7787857.1 TonB-dependent receptor [Calditrichota bacterium]
MGKKPSILFLTLITGLLFGLLPLTLIAQTATLNGRVIDEKTGDGIAGAHVVVVVETLKEPLGTASDLNGGFVIKDIPEGNIEVETSCIGYKTNNAILTIEENAVLTVEFSLKPVALLGQEVVVSISKRQEKILEAPAAVSVVSSEEVKAQPTMTPAEHLEGLPAVDVVKNGVSQRNVVVRGFNNIFSGTLLSLTDNRIARVPSLRINAHNFYTMVNEDIDRIEVVLGPGSALYGPNSANGVFHIITKSPFDSPGTMVSLGGGERSIFMGTARHAGIINDKVAYKVSAQYQQADDWRSYDLAEPDSIGSGNEMISNERNFDIEKISADARVDYRVSEDLTIIANGGFNQATNLEATGLGWAQSDKWNYSFVQGRILYKDFFAQIFYNMSDAGDSRLLRPDTLSLLVDKSSLLVAQVQNATKLGMRQQFTYGVDILMTRPETEGTINGGNEDDDDIDEIGVYLQSETAITKKIDFVAAGRYDQHNRLEDPVLSPRAAIVYKPTENDNFRLTYNRAYSTPTSNNLFLDLIASSQPLDPALGLGSTMFDVWGRGVPEDGFSFKFLDGRAQMVSLYGSVMGIGNAYLPPDVNSVWPAIRGMAIAGTTDPGEQALLGQLLPDALGQIIPGVLQVLNTDYDSDMPMGPDNMPFINPQRAVADIKPIKETTTSTMEIGYKGLITDKLLVSAAIYQSRIDDYVGPLSVETPHVFINAASLVGVLAADMTPKLMAMGIPAEQAEAQAIAIATGIAEKFGPLPIGLISPQEQQNATDVVVTYRNFEDSITLTGGEFGFTYILNSEWRIGGTYSYTDKNMFEQLDGIADVSLNAPKSKFAFRLGYNNARCGLDAKLRIRHVGEFQSLSVIGMGTVDSYTVADLNIGYDLPIPSINQTRLNVTIQNLLNEEHLEFIGAPEMGRLVIARVSYWF